MAAVGRAVELAKAAGAKRCIMLPVSAPFHCVMMAPAARVMEERLAEVSMSQPVVPLVANVTAEEVRDPAEIRRLLVEQVTALVRWRESVRFMKRAGVDTVVEVGAGKVLSGLVRRIDRELNSSAIGTPAEIEAFLKTT